MTEFKQNCVKVVASIRIVPPFSIQSTQKNTIVYPPPRIDIFYQQPCSSTFRKYFLRGDIPCVRSYRKNTLNSKFLSWKTAPETLELSYYLPIFFEGLCDKIDSYRQIAANGITDLLRTAHFSKILNCVPQLILPIKKALNTKTPVCMIATMRAIQQLVMTGPCIGQALVPYYRQILPVMNLFRNERTCNGDQIQFNSGLGDVIDETLQILEYYGGPNAYTNIKYIIPTYESFVMN